MRRLNDWLALRVTAGVGTMWCAYVFAVIGVVGVVATLTGDAWVTLLVGAVSSYFFQLVLIPIIIVGQNLQNRRFDEHASKLDAIHERLGIDDNN